MTHLDNCIAHAENVVANINSNNVHPMYLQEAYSHLMFALPPNYGLVPYKVCSKNCGDNPFIINDKLANMVEIAKEYRNSLKQEIKPQKTKTLSQHAQA